MLRLIPAALPLTLLLCLPALSPAATPPNIVFIMVDDLGYNELGCYGQTKILTPHIDQMAAEGLRFTQCYAGSTVCAPARSTLMTGLHTGRTPIRANGGATALLPEDATVAKALKQAGYATGMFGKWGLGFEGTPGQPNRQGFDEFFGYMRQVHAHFFYPYFLWHNETVYPLPGNEGNQRGQYSHDEIHAQALDFIRANKDRPFFAYLPYTIPHVELVVPEESMAPYRGKWDETPLPDPRPGYIGADEPYATFAGMVSHMDRQVGEIFALLKELNLDENTIVFFTSDNGGQGGAWQRMTDFFEGNAPFRGYKGDFYEGGIRVPMIARWPGRIAPGTTTDHICAFWDVFPTLTELAGVAPPEKTDGISFVPTLLGRSQQAHDIMYWEYPFPRGLVQAARMGDWKLLQSAPGRPFELYNLANDIGEQNNLADAHPEIVQKIVARLEQEHESPRVYGPLPRPYRAPDFVR